VVTLCTGVTNEAYRNPGRIFCIRHTCPTGVLSQVAMLGQDPGRY
jgi:hypothetical protein